MTKTAVITMRQLLEAGVHFGHQTKRGNPKMKKYIFTARNDIHIIDLQKTIKLVADAYEFAKDVSAKGGKVIFVGTKKQAQLAVKEEAERCGMSYINQRWLGGTLTNFKTIRRSIRKLKNIEKMKQDKIFDKLPAKEQASLNREYNRLVHYIGGISELVDLPKAIFIIDTNKEEIAVQEAIRLNIPIIGVVDTNCDPSHVTYPIPANDDAIRSIKLLASVISNAVLEGNANLVSDFKDSETTDSDIDFDMKEIENSFEEKLKIEEEFVLDEELKTEEEKKLMKKKELEKKQ